jgi:hypothetical protein
LACEQIAVQAFGKISFVEIRAFGALNVDGSVVELLPFQIRGIIVRLVGVPLLLAVLVVALRQAVGQIGFVEFLDFYKIVAQCRVDVFAL